MNFKLCYSTKIFLFSLKFSYFLDLQSLKSIPLLERKLRSRLNGKINYNLQRFPIEHKRHPFGTLLSAISLLHLLREQKCNRLLPALAFSLKFSDAADETSWQPTIRLNFVTVVKTIFIVISRLLNFRFDKIPFLLPNLQLFTGQRERLRWNSTFM